MSMTPIITFKAGICELDAQSSQAKPQQTPGYIYLYSEDDLIHFCWRPRSAPHTEPELDLVMVPSDGTFIPYQPDGKPTNGRIYVLKFSSSSQRYLFWLQSKSQSEDADPSYWSPRDLRLGEIVNNLLQGEDVDVETEIANLPKGPSNGDDDETMEDVEGVDHDPNHPRGGSGGGAGPDATGGDVREEGQGSREGGADGGRAAQHGSAAPSAVVQDFLKSLGGNQSQEAEHPFTTLQDLLSPSTTLPYLESLETDGVDNLLKYLPQELLILALQMENPSATQSRPEDVLSALSLPQKKNVLRKVLHSPQFTQSLASLTVAIRDGGLPTISEALRIPVENGGFMRRGGVPLGGGDAMKAFVQGVRDHVKDASQQNHMQTD